MNNFNLSGSAIILNEKGEVLFHHRTDYDLWTLPGGGIEAGESPWQGVVREVEEEIGLKVDLVSLNGVYWKPSKNEICFYFICKIISGKVRYSDEADAVCYLDIYQPIKNCDLSQLSRVKEILNDKTKTIFSELSDTTLDKLKNNIY